MKTPTLILFGLAAALLGGCATPAQQAARAPYVKPHLIMLTADQAQARGIKVAAAPGTEQQQPVPLPAGIDALDASAVVTPAGVKVYTINRSVDPFDSEVMHEEHVVYRRETPPRWRLNAPTDQKIMVGPKITDGQQRVDPIADKELTTFLNDQRRVAQSQQQAITALFKAVDSLSRQQEALLRRELQNGATGEPDKEPEATPPANPAADKGATP